MSASFTTRFVAALTARNAEQFSRDTETAISNAERSKVAIDEVMSRPEFKEVAGKLVKGARIAQAQQDRDNFIAVKVLVKIVSCLSAIGQGRAAELDPYSRCIVAQIMHCNELNNKAAMVALSRSVEFTETDKVYSLDARKRYNCTVGTASTQMSSSRMMLNYLGMGKVSKGKRDDEFCLLDNGRAHALMSLFTDKVISEEVQPEGTE